MRDETAEPPKKLRSGYTTGACATATALAAARLLLSNQITTTATIELPRGQKVAFALTECVKLDNRRARASTIKDAGDDPDATHGATVFAEIVLAAITGVRFYAAPGVGTITRAGLSFGIGEAAINPVPRQMITAHLQALARVQNYTGGFEVHIGVRDGEKIALKTMNHRLGIVGGLSILGTTGIVRPFSCAAYIASIRQSIDVAHANGITHIAASTGATSERFIQSRLGLSDMALVEMGDFAGAVFKHLRNTPIPKLTLCGGFGKITKMAAGHTSLHSQHSAIDFTLLAQWVAELAADRALIDAVRGCNTTLQALRQCQQKNIAIGDYVCNLARQTALAACRGAIQIAVFCVDKAGDYAGHAE